MRARGFHNFLLLALVLWGSEAQGRGSTKTWVEAMGTTPSCTLDVVLVTFKDTSATGNSNLDYHLHDLPYKYTQHGAPGDSSYKLADFERLFNGGYDAATVFLGDTVTVANRDTLPAVFGSVRAYYDSMSLDPQARAMGGRPMASSRCTRG